MTVDLAPITDADVADVADFLHGIFCEIPSSTWSRAMSMPWMTHAPNHGFMLRDGRRVVGAYLAFYSERRIAGRVERFCNLDYWNVLTEYRFHSIRLLKALLAQDGYHFTDLTPNPTVESVDAGLKFRYLDTSVALIPHLPWPSLPYRTKISTDPDTIAGALSGPDLKVYRDHAQAPAAHHLVLIRGSESCYVMFRRRWWRGRPIFAAIIYVSNQSLFQRSVTLLARYLLVHYRLLATFAELRIVGARPRTSVMLPQPKAVRRRNPRFPRSYAQRYRSMFPPKMYRSASLEPDQIDDLYSDLAFDPVAW